MGPTFSKKTLNVYTVGRRWMLTPKRIEQRENRTLLRERDFEFMDNMQLRRHMISHDMQVLAKWLQRELIRAKSVLVNSPNVSISRDIGFESFEVYITQKAIPFDSDLWQRHAGITLMLPAGQSVYEIPIFSELPLAVWSNG